MDLIFFFSLLTTDNITIFFIFPSLFTSIIFFIDDSATTTIHSTTTDGSCNTSTTMRIKIKKFFQGILYLIISIYTCICYCHIICMYNVLIRILLSYYPSSYKYETHRLKTELPNTIVSPSFIPIDLPLINCLSLTQTNLWPPYGLG